MDPIEHFKPGEVVIKEGTKGTSAYIILSGKAEVVKRSGERTISMATLGKGQVFGDMGLVEDRPRSASVRALSGLKVRVIDREKFNELLHSKPTVLVPIMKILFERLRRTTNMLAEVIPTPTLEDGKVYTLMAAGDLEDMDAVLLTDN